MSDQDEADPKAVMRPLNERELEHAKRESKEKIDAATEKGRRQLAALEAASLHNSIVSPKLRFS